MAHILPVRARYRVYHRPVTSAAAPSGPATVPGRARGLAGLTPTRPGRRPRSWALYDFANTIFSFAVVSGRDRAVPRRTPVRRARRQRCWLSIAIVVERRHQRARVADPRGLLGPRRWPDAVPAVLHGAVHRRDVLHRSTCRRSAGSILFIVANFAYQAALIYYDATLKIGQLSGDARQAVRARHGHRLLRDGLRRDLLIFFLDVPVADRFRLTSLLFLLFAIPIFVFVREPRIDGQRGDHRRPRSGTRSGSSGGRSRTRARSRDSGGSSSAGSSIPMRSTRSSWS